MKKNLYPNDPQALAESKKYDNPIPSREYILLVIKNAPTLPKIRYLIDQMTVHKSHIPSFKHRLKAMVRDGELIRTRNKSYQIPINLPVIKGRVYCHPNGHGIIESYEENSKYIISAREMRKVMHGDIVEAEVIYQTSGNKSEATIKQVLQYNTKEIIGKLKKEHGILFVTSINQHQCHDVIILDPPPKVKKDDFVVAEITVQPSLKSLPFGKIIKIVSPKKKRFFFNQLISTAFQIPSEWSEQLLKRANSFNTEISDKKAGNAIKAGRKDYRKFDFCTIDGKSAKDFDDALYCQKHTQGWQLIVAIADVSHYVKDNDLLDKEAQKRGNSVYLPGTTIPMLPEELSNGLCSLNPNCNRFALCCDMIIDPSGTVKQFEFYEAVIQSSARLTYKKTYRLINSKNHKEWQNHPKNLKNSLLNLRELYNAQKTARQHRGSIDIDTSDVEFKLSLKGKIKKIQPVKRNKAHRIVEECMLMANVCAAKLLRQHNKKFLYRIHDQPKSEKLQNLKELLLDLNIKHSISNPPSAKDFSNILKQCKNKPYYHIVLIAILRTFKQAVYSQNNKGHFALNYDQYTHFTSPIRRYPDLIVHRAIKETIHQDLPLQNWSEEKLNYLSDHLSNTEKRAEVAERDCSNLLKCEYANNHIGQMFTGTVSRVVNFGLFVDLDDIFIEGLLHISQLSNSYFHYDAIKHKLINQREKKTYAIGDTLKVIIHSVSVEERKINLKLSH